MTEQKSSLICSNSIPLDQAIPFFSSLLNGEHAHSFTATRLPLFRCDVLRLLCHRFNRDHWLSGIHCDTHTVFSTTHTHVRIENKNVEQRTEIFLI